MGCELQCWRDVVPGRYREGGSGGVLISAKAGEDGVIAGPDFAQGVVAVGVSGGPGVPMVPAGDALEGDNGVGER